MIGPDGEAWTLESFTEGAETTGVWSVVTYSDVASTLRFEPEYYQPEYLALEKTLEGIVCTTLEELSKAISCGPFGSNLLKTTYVEDGVIVLRPFNIENATISDKNLVYIPRSDIEAQGLSLYEPEDVAFARVGDIRCGILPDFGNPITISPNIIMAQLDKQKVNPAYVAVFMNTALGMSQLERALKVVAQPTVTVDTIKSLLIPHLSQDQQAHIENLLKSSFRQRDRSKSLYAEAEALLLDALGLDAALDAEAEAQRTYTQPASRAWSAGRLDAEYFQPIYARIEQAIQQHQYARLGVLIEPLTNGYDYRNYVEEGTPYIRVGDVNQGRLDLKGAAKVDITIEDVDKNVNLQVGDVLFTRKGTFGNAAVVREGQTHVIISSEIMRLRLKDQRIQPDYLALFLNSDAGYLQVERRVHGVAYYSISQPDLESVFIPILPDDFQLRLTQLVQQSIKTEQEAHRLLEEAKRRVEAMILAEGNS